MCSNTEQSDLVVVGSGVAGLAATLAAVEAGARVMLLSGGALLSGSSPVAQGGIAAAVGQDDTPDLHALDTFTVGGGLNDSEAVHVLVHAGRTAVLDLLASGVPFDGGREHPHLGLEAGHGRRRILHANGEATGRAVTESLLARVVEHPLVRVHAQTSVHDLVWDGDRVVGVRSGGTTFRGRAVVLATGGYASLWSRTTNAPATRGDGLALAWRAGASLADLEFVQFHPTALNVPGRPAYLLSEAVRGEGALLVDGLGHPVVDPLLPRDVVARAVVRHARENGPVYLSLQHLEPGFVYGRFPNITAQLHTWGLNLARDMIPVAPAAHYCMGGVRSDSFGRTDLPGLYVAGEVACTGAQGANRLASNSLLECLVFGSRAARTALADLPAMRAGWETTPLPSSEHDGPTARSAESTPPESAQLGELLDSFLGVARRAEDLRSLISCLPQPETAQSGAELVAALAARGALLRAESRGAHYRTDMQDTTPAWQGRILWRRGEEPRFERIHA